MRPCGREAVRPYILTGGLTNGHCSGVDVRTTPVSDVKAPAHLLPLDEFLRLWEPQKWIIRTIWGL